MNCCLANVVREWGETMSEKDILAQIEADLQSGNDVVEWSGVRVMNEAERKTEYLSLIHI